VIEILVLQALSRQLRGDTAEALTALERAVALAAPERHVRVFVDEGPPMADLLRGVTTGDSATTAHARSLLEALGQARAPGRPTSDVLVEPLSEREHEVLRLLATDLSGPEIASRLVLSLNTVRTHTKNVYAKLGVNSRRAAVRRAEELGL
jgi:LuxR family maltose regulon positive regulatory protein